MFPKGPEPYFETHFYLRIKPMSRLFWIGWTTWHSTFLWTSLCSHGWIWEDKVVKSKISNMCNTYLQFNKCIHSALLVYSPFSAKWFSALFPFSNHLKNWHLFHTVILTIQGFVWVSSSLRPPYIKLTTRSFHLCSLHTL